MIARTEHAVGHMDLGELASQFETKTLEAVKATTTDLKALAAANSIVRDYHKQAAETTLNSLYDVGMTAAEHYNKVLKLDLNKNELKTLVADLIQAQLSEKYHGATLQERFNRNQAASLARLTKASRTGVSLETRQLNLSRHFAKPYPYGAQVNFDQRILTGQAVLLEHQIAKTLGEKAKSQFVVWTLSHKHSKEDICDKLATQVDKKVKEALQAADISVSPKGVYFLKDIPNPPHPNCRCTLRFIAGNQVDTAGPERPLSALRKLWSKITKKRRNTAAK